MTLTKVYLMNIPLEKDYKHTYYFGNLNAQSSYFLGKESKSFSDLSYQRKDSTMRIPLKYEEAIKYNYVVYQHTDLYINGVVDNKYYYAFIIDYEFKGEDSTNITIETDVIQTWMFDYELLPSFVEREHTNDDTIGLNTIPENLECGDFVCNNVVHNKRMLDKGIIVGSTRELDKQVNEDFEVVSGNLYNGIFSGIKYYYFSEHDIVNELLKGIADKGYAEAIQCVFTAPSTFIPTQGGGLYEVLETPSGVERDWNYANLGGESDVLPDKPNSVNGYAPKNNKLLTFPFCYMLASNNAGSCNIYKYEYFKDKIDFKIAATITPGMSIRLLPKNYKGVEVNNEEGLTAGKYPICSWATDTYTNWLTQNSVNIATDLLTGAGMIVGGSIATAYGGGAVGLGVAGGGVGMITNTLTNIHQMQFQSPSAQGNINSGDVNYSTGRLTFSLYQMSIKEEYAKIIDEYFDMFGYKTNRVKVPNKYHRTSWWFTKTIDVNINGNNIPSNDLQKIKECYNNGITFWNTHSGAKIKDYTQQNHVME